MTKEFQIGNIKVVLGDTEAIGSFDAVVVILFAREKVVLIRNKNRAWEFPGGHRNGGESFEEAAAREAYEEAGAGIIDIEYLGHYVTSTGFVTVIVCAGVASGQEIAGGGEAVVGLFDELPASLSFGDGREQLFLEYAREKRGL